MAYNPNYRDAEKARQDQRERVYALTLLSGIGNIAALFLHINGIATIMLGWLVGGMVGALVVAGIQGRTDDYYNQLTSSGLRLMALGLGTLLLLLWAQTETALAARWIPGLAVLAQDALLLAMILTLLFHLGYAYSYLRDRWAAGGPE
ncbi:hypothetical protein U4960_08890 [Altererythrobacter sp. H2]|uniref:hypothetical protein n=1 Tax=Altererythrobacter sp. H2 TaxID=3108391 RepID=UPI002B4BF86B|nr:hypothetical protein [Altererythrobacter sp. H2]WRK94419.1 hypothetical protein U4960_08890 [Altererythrobacter sp. H2]